MNEPHSQPEPVPADMSYEQAVERLEEIVARIEGGELGLEESIALYEQGVALGKRCREILTRAEQRVQQLGRDQMGLEGDAGTAAGQER